MPLLFFFSELPLPYQCNSACWWHPEVNVSTMCELGSGGVSGNNGHKNSGESWSSNCLMEKHHTVFIGFEREEAVQLALKVLNKTMDNTSLTPTQVPLGSELERIMGSVRLLDKSQWRPI
ncbi:hypothetical protein IFM89_039231 [Coptis chinensis]|uniref:Uncharacterized protein n=1 Tax=Coptis chinensis TaxID=261450 RepID=A0A835ILQ4_9MAGN|nr:hypothetical protein IFM89_039231 [Coptis chinensis]